MIRIGLEHSLEESSRLIWLVQLAMSFRGEYQRLGAAIAAS